MLTKEECINAYYRQTFYHISEKDSRGFPVQCRVNGKCKTWKTRPNEFRLPVKYGLKQCFYITESNNQEWCSSMEGPLLHPLKKHDDWTKFVTLTGGNRPTQFICSQCKRGYFIPKVGESISTGYASNDKGDLLCYSCCAENDKKYMIEHGKIMLYLSDKKIEPPTGDKFGHTYYEVTNWPGSLKFKTCQFNEGRHNIARKRYNVWFNGPDGFVWYGVQYGDNTQICHCKRTKVKA